MALGGHFEKRGELKLPKGDTSTPSGIFKQGVWAAVFCKEKNYILQVQVYDHGCRTRGGAIIEALIGITMQCCRLLRSGFSSYKFYLFMLSCFSETNLAVVFLVL